MQTHANNCWRVLVWQTFCYLTHVLERTFYLDHTRVSLWCNPISELFPVDVDVCLRSCQRRRDRGRFKLFHYVQRSRENMFTIGVQKIRFVTWQFSRSTDTGLNDSKRIIANVNHYAIALFMRSRSIAARFYDIDTKWQSVMNFLLLYSQWKSSPLAVGRRVIYLEWIHYDK